MRYTNDCFRPKPHLYLHAYLQLVRTGLEEHVSTNVELPASFLKGFFFVCVTRWWLSFVFIAQKSCTAALKVIAPLALCFSLSHWPTCKRSVIICTWHTSVKGRRGLTGPYEACAMTLWASNVLKRQFQGTGCTSLSISLYFFLPYCLTCPLQFRNKCNVHIYLIFNGFSLFFLD